MKSKFNKNDNDDDKKSMNNNDQQNPNHKQIMKCITKLDAIHINSNDLMENVSIKCRLLSNFLIFYQTLKYHFSNYNVFIRDLKDVSNANLSEPSGLTLNSDTHNFMKKVVHYLLSKEGVFMCFPEGLQALELTISGHEILNVTLSRERA